MREIIATGKTVEQATENGCKELGLPREQVSVEIIDMPVKKLFKTLPAKVKVTAIEEIVEEVFTVEEVIQKPETKAEVKQAPVKKQQESPKKENRVLPNEPEVKIDVENNEQVAKGIEYLRSILAPIGGAEANIEAYRQGEATLFRMSEGDISSIFNVNGDSIQALSYLVDRAANKGVDKHSDEYLHVRLDISGYRDRREEELVELANKVAREVNKTHKSRTLPPMNSYERLIIHTAIGEMDGLVSESIGRDSDRRVVIKSTAEDATHGGDWKMNYKGHNNRNRKNRGRNDRNHSINKNHSNDNRNRTPKREYDSESVGTEGQPIVPKTREALNDGDELPLYGKIEL